MLPQTAGTVKVSCITPVVLTPSGQQGCHQQQRHGGKTLHVPAVHTEVRSSWVTQHVLLGKTVNELRGLRNNQQLHLKATTLNFRARNKTFFFFSLKQITFFFPQSSSPDNAAPCRASGTCISHGSKALNTGRITMLLLSHTSGCTEGLL